MTKRYFITGTDTNVGKTLAACALLQAAISIGYHAAGYKPVATGYQLTLDGPRNNDALALLSNSNVILSYSQVNPLVFSEPTSPHIACRAEGRNIELSELSAGLKVIEQKSDWIVVEGAGGWFTPLGEGILYSDWVNYEKLPVILVIGMKLGCINHALLTALAIRQFGLQLVGWIANHIQPTTTWSQHYLAELRNRLDAPLIGDIPWLSNIPVALLAKYINLAELS
ncbi:dethiobiotin synthase [Candidatus Palibaumannia cicadellinicola]|uniref:ATP-dependent dethiobiotin synthetase BioD n=1 Tax=Baumannia cicadellinicola subsp. Homalodisca coagulata TaxID=374463 RepID=BIOD_BAUCH|nr:dethiobiotin synthase [Candidatus Baumannia cicadellinicola]Q1LTL5.1 RecName: Full=ATP-dependent dethiobiotin synthetase BioD; AltName: Full=DTB synthetase; Short=DTBS; AltName: Full=Dethiobiotin synthase [Baumannia cicadellinicola str. Hc (Homalodisca coagulata)]ABF13909.1 dethiobiotin synthase [Baumannia cicadellinicola str. Hc (Homalodisca coagulata)]MCJ7462318.1 dethiobiotin synthase [Candidatus Baumannia cicadellinicola]MCJ7462838.1 dethiobiotin synthase [Candidatus Baumannia cicadellin